MGGKNGTPERSLPPCHSERSEEPLGTQVRDSSSASGLFGMTAGLDAPRQAGEAGRFVVSPVSDFVASFPAEALPQNPFLQHRMGCAERLP